MNSKNGPDQVVPPQKGVRGLGCRFFWFTIEGTVDRFSLQGLSLSASRLVTQLVSLTGGRS